MSALKKTVYLYAKAPRYGAELDYWISGSKELGLDSFGRVVASADVTFDVPELNPVAMAIEELEAEKAEAGRKFRETVKLINDQLSKLQAITNEVPA